MNESLGPVIRGLLTDGITTDIMLNPGGRVYRDGKGGMSFTGYTMPAGDANAIMRLVAFNKRQPLTRGSPMIINGELPGTGYRISGTIEPVTPDGPSFAIRVPIVEIGHGFASAAKPRATCEGGIVGFEGDYLRQLQDAVRRKKNILIAGATGSGKTFLASILLREMAHERVLAFEDKPELVISSENHVRFISIKGVVSQRELLEQCLRYRGDRIVAGELLDGETARALVHSANTGHRGFVSTIHANSAAHVPARVVSLCSNLRESISVDDIKDAIDVVAYCEKFPDESRAITEVIEL
jgi:type IV secretion system protein VirB11